MWFRSETEGVVEFVVIDTDKAKRELLTKFEDTVDGDIVVIHDLQQGLSNLTRSDGRPAFLSLSGVRRLRVSLILSSPSQGPILDERLMSFGQSGSRGTVTFPTLSRDEMREVLCIEKNAKNAFDEVFNVLDGVPRRYTVSGWWSS